MLHFRQSRRPAGPRIRKLRWLVVASILAAISFTLTTGRPALASILYPTGSTGYSVSWPQCGSTSPNAPATIAIVGVTGGRAFTKNPCLGAQFTWAGSAGAVPGLYMNLNYVVGSTASNGLSGPRGNCRRNDKECQAYNYGYNAAADAVAYARTQGADAATWWLDIETTNSWSKSTGLNALVIQGAIAGLRDNRVTTVGIYSTAYQWRTIAGSFSPGLPNWVAGASSLDAARNYCLPTYAFGGGTVWLVQYPAGNYDGVYAC